MKLNLVPGEDRKAARRYKDFSKEEKNALIVSATEKITMGEADNFTSDEKIVVNSGDRRKLENKLKKLKRK